MEEFNFNNDICNACVNESFDKCKATFEQITLDDISRNVVACDYFEEKPKHKIKITFECNGKVATVDKEVYELPDYLKGLKWQKMKSKISKDEIDEIVTYLNDRTGKNYRSSSKKVQQLIKARADENFTVADFKKVIDNKVTSWKNDPKMSVYLRPSTLFGTKFEEYLNEIQVKSLDKLQSKPSYDLAEIKRKALMNTEI